MVKFFTVLHCLLVSTALWAQTVNSSATPLAQPKRPLTPADYDGWQSVRSEKNNR